MATTRKIFIGSSHEASKLAKAVKDVIKGVEHTEVRTWDEVSKPGLTLLEWIETLPFDYQGAVLLWTPDVSSRRAEQFVETGVPNVMFEYGSLAARLTRTRVVICRFGDAEIPSDLRGLVQFEIEKYQPQARTLPPKTIKDIRRWVDQMPLLAERIPAIVQVHGYSGTWNVKSTFSRWRGEDVRGEEVFFNGKTFLMLRADGLDGSGIQIGTTYVRFKDYNAEYEMVNKILNPHVDEKGGLHMHVKMIRREGPKNESDPKRRRPEGLTSDEFPLELEVVAGQTLTGDHKYDPAIVPYQIAAETWEYSGQFGPL